MTKAEFIMEKLATPNVEAIIGAVAKRKNVESAIAGAGGNIARSAKRTEAQTENISGMLAERANASQHRSGLNVTPMNRKSDMTLISERIKDPKPKGDGAAFGGAMADGILQGNGGYARMNAGVQEGQGRLIDRAKAPAKAQQLSKTAPGRAEELSGKLNTLNTMQSKGKITDGLHEKYTSKHKDALQMLGSEVHSTAGNLEATAGPTGQSERMWSLGSKVHDLTENPVARPSRNIKPAPVAGPAIAAPAQTLPTAAPAQSLPAPKKGILSSLFSGKTA